ncbi:Hormone-sensitive lipase [Galdieria sulphuraria]|nr:Hormone-sensitive lipase [Galdieria sulphuraria]
MKLRSSRVTLEAFKSCITLLEKLQLQVELDKNRNRTSTSSERLEEKLQDYQSLLSTLEATKELVEPLVQSNGFDTLLYILHSLLCKIRNLCEKLLDSPSGWKSLFQKRNILEKLLARHEQLRSFYAILYLAIKMKEAVDVTQTLLVSEKIHPDFTLSRWKQVVKTDAFFGRYFGFHYQSDIRQLLRMTLVAKETIHKTYEGCQKEPKFKTISLLGWGWFYSHLQMFEQLGLDVKHAKQLGIELSSPPTIEQIRAFWNLIEEPFLAGLTQFVSADVSTDKTFCIPPPCLHSLRRFEENLSASHFLRLPSSEVRNPVQIRYISYHWRNISEDTIQQSDAVQKMEMEDSKLVSSGLTEKLSHQMKNIGVSWDGWLRNKANDPAKGLIVHIHGDLPNSCIVSIDYKLSPEHKYPVALEECTYVYTWLLEHHDLLCTTAERIVVVGDSAGGNLALAMVLKLLTRGLRIPDGIVLAYPALYLFPAWSPSRLLSLFDPLLPASVLEICMKAYLPENVNAYEDLPSLLVIAGGLDPLLDDSVVFVHRLRRWREDTEIQIFPNLPHGFLNMGLVVPQALEAIRLVSKWLAIHLQVEWCGNTS